MRAFIASVLAASVFANKSAPIGGFDYTQGGDNWAASSNVCGTGKKQSPVDLLTAEDKITESEKLKINISTLGSNPVASRDKATTNMEVNYNLDFDKSWADTATVKRTDSAGTEKTYNPVSVQWHTPSEHTVDGKHYDAEAQIYSDDADGKLAVVSVFFDKSVGGGAQNDWVKSFVAGYNDRFNTDANAKAKVDMSLMFRPLSEEKGFWMYDGSLTYPPCTEGVAWTVMKDVLRISQDQLDWLYRFTKGAAEGAEINATEQKYLDYVKTNTANANNAAGNNRRTQALNDRKLYMAHEHDHDHDHDHDDHDHDKDAASNLMTSAAALAAVALLNF